MFDILTLIPGRKKRTTTGWHSFNAVCCHHRGHKADKRSRGGIKFDENNWTYHCFNCNFKAGFVLGKNISEKTRTLLKWCGADDDQISGWNLYSLKHRDLLDLSLNKKSKKKISFKELELPENCELITTDDPKHEKFVDYIQNVRGLSLDEYPFMCTPTAMGRNRNRIIIPYTFKNKIVGHTSRFLDGRDPKYIKEQQPGYIFGCDLQKEHWEIGLVFEGVFDSIAMNGYGLTHDSISPEQAEFLQSTRKRIIVVPDLDKSGLTICEQALDYGFQVSIPNWEEGIKDANDSVIKYGKLATLLSILQAATSSKIKVDLARRKRDKRL